jgi:hypothetical protein
MANYAHPNLRPAHPQQCTTWTLDDIQWVAHWMATDGNINDPACVAGYMAELNDIGKKLLTRCLDLQASYCNPIRRNLP